MGGLTRACDRHASAIALRRLARTVCGVPTCGAVQGDGAGLGSKAVELELRLQCGIAQRRPELAERHLEGPARRHLHVVDNQINVLCATV